MNANLTRMQVPISQGYCNSFGLKAGACMLVKNGDDMNLKSKQKKAGSKLAKKAFSGVLGLRNGIGAAGRLALEGKLGNKKH